MNTGQPKELSASLSAEGFRFAIVVSRWNSLVTKELLGGAMDALVRHGAAAQDQTVVWAPGSFEIPMVVQALLKKGGFDGVIALGCVMRGQTSHNEHIAAEVTKGIGSLSLEYDVPVGFGILTPDSMEQALDRAGLKMGNKGAEAAMAVVEMAQLKKLIAE